MDVKMEDERMKRFVENFDVNAYTQKFKSSEYYKNRVIPKITKIINNHYEQEISNRIVFDSNKSSLIYPEFHKIRITQRALDKGKYIAKSLCDIAKGNYEIYMYLIGNDSVIDDIYIGHDQIVWSDLCKMYSPGKIKTSFDIRNMGKKILGWSHSHGGLSTFHSDIDKNNLHKFAFRARKKQIDLHDDDDESIDSKLYSIKYTASLVFNKYLWGTDDLPFSGVAMSYIGYGTRDVNYHINERVNIEVVPSESFLEPEYKGIDKQIIERVTLYDKGPLKNLVAKHEEKDRAENERI